jgi:hypothetical protein
VSLALVLLVADMVEVDVPVVVLLVADDVEVDVSVLTEVVPELLLVLVAVSVDVSVVGIDVVCGCVGSNLLVLASKTRPDFPRKDIMTMVEWPMC